MLTIESVWLSDRATECGFRRSEVRFLMGTHIFFFDPHLWQDKKHLSPFCLFYSIYKLDTIDITDPSSMLEACHMNFVIDLAHHSLWLSGREMEHRIWRSEVQFLMGTQVFFLFPTLMTRQKTSFSTSLTSSKVTISLTILFIVLIHVKYLILSPMQSLHKSSMVNRSVSRYHHHSKPTVKEWNCNSPKKTFSWSLKHYTPHLGGRSFIVMTLYSF